MYPPIGNGSNKSPKEHWSLWELEVGTWKELLARTDTTALVIKVPESTLGRHVPAPLPSARNMTGRDRHSPCDSSESTRTSSPVFCAYSCCGFFQVL